MAVPKDGTADYPLGASVIALAPGPLDGPGSCLPGPRAATLVRAGRVSRGKEVPPSAMAVRRAPTVEQPSARMGSARTSTS
jgi:hypothetical protein